jgi:O-antigen ligase
MDISGKNNVSFKVGALAVTWPLAKTIARIRLPGSRWGRSKPLPIVTSFVVVFQCLLIAFLSLQYITYFYFFILEGLMLFFILFIVSPKKALMAFLFIRPTLDCLQQYSNIGITSINNINAAVLFTLTLLLCGCVYFLINKVDLFRLAHGKCFLSFILICLISLLYAHAKADGLSEVLRFASIFVAYALVLTLFTTAKDIFKLINTILFSSVIPLVVGFLQIFTHRGYLEVSNFITGSTLSRIYSTFTHPNMYAFYIIFLLPMCILFFLELKDMRKKIIIAFFIAALCISLLFTFTRGAWIGFLIALLVIGIMKYKKIFFVTIVIVALLIICVPMVSYRFADIFLPANTAAGIDSFHWRINLWKNAFPYFLQKPLFGNGLGNFYEIAATTEGSLTAAHNDYLRILVDTGIFGLGIYLMLLIALARQSWRIYKNSKYLYSRTFALGMFSLCVVYFVISASDNVLRTTVVQFYFWTFAAIMINLNRIESRIHQTLNARYQKNPS